MKIDELRKSIDKVDEEIVRLLAERKSIAKEIGKEKKIMRIPVVDVKREKEILENLRKKAKENGLEPDFIERLFRNILENSRKVQKNNG